jgi:hypothetical protein
VTTRRLNGSQAKARSSVLVALALAAAAAAGCDLPPNPRHPKLLNFAHMEALATSGAPTFATDDGIPGGLRVPDFVTTDGTSYQLTLRNTWTEGYRSAYETAEMWTGFDEIWVQPVYVPITGFSGGKPVLLGADPTNPDPTKRGWNPIFSVGPDSAFYSPFWQTFYFIVPADTDPEAFTTARKVIDSGLPLIPGPGHTMSIVPGDNVHPATMTMGAVDQEVGGPTATSPGYLDGQDVDYLDFGKNNFTWNDDLVVEPTPLFVLVYRDPDSGELKRMNVPTVAGTGPLYANRTANVTGDVPHYGALWRLYTVEVPPTARIFAPPLPEFADTIADYPPALVGPHYGANVIASGAVDLAFFLGRVALNAVPSADMSDPGCFDDRMNLGKSGKVPCQWLDSQPALEQAVPPSWIRPTDILVTCPFISYHDSAVVVTP